MKGRVLYLDDAYLDDATRPPGFDRLFYLY